MAMQVAFGARGGAHFRGGGGRGGGGRGRGRGPTIASVAEAAAAAAIRNEEEVPRRQDATYTREQNYFMEWVDEKREEGLIPFGPDYLTRENVDACTTSRILSPTDQWARKAHDGSSPPFNGWQIQQLMLEL